MTLNVNAPDFRLPDDLQAIYDHVAAHLLRQGRPAKQISPRGTTLCCYRSPSGDKCAIGALIPDARYKPSMEGKWGLLVLASIDVLPWEEAEEGNTPRAHLLGDLRAIHDASIDWSEEEVAPRWKALFRYVAEDYNLRPFTRDMLSNKE